MKSFKTSIIILARLVFYVSVIGALFGLLVIDLYISDQLTKYGVAIFLASLIGITLSAWGALFLWREKRQTIPNDLSTGEIKP